MKKMRQIKIVFMSFAVGCILILSSAFWLPLLQEQKSTIDYIKEDLTLKEDTTLLDVIDNYDDISAPVEQDEYKKNFNLYSSDNPKEETYAKFLNNVIVKFATYRDTETDKAKIVMYKNIISELLEKYDFIVSLKEIPTTYDSNVLDTSTSVPTVSNASEMQEQEGNDATNEKDIDNNVELPDSLKEKSEE